MFPKFHLLSGLIGSIILFLLFPNISRVGILIFFAASFLIDFDHYLYYAIKQKDLSLKRALKWHYKKAEKFKKLKAKERKKYNSSFYCFHGLEWIILFLLLGAYWNFLFYFVAAGMLFHLVFDWFEIILGKRKIHRISVILDYFQSQNSSRQQSTNFKKQSF